MNLMENTTTTVCVMDAASSLGFQLVHSLLRRGYLVHAAFQSNSLSQGSFLLSFLFSFFCWILFNYSLELILYDIFTSLFQLVMRWLNSYRYCEKHLYLENSRISNCLLSDNDWSFSLLNNITSFLRIFLFKYLFEYNRQSTLYRVVVIIIIKS